MATTLSYGFVRPQDGDTGATFWDDLEDDITQLNDHTHNGVDSAPLAKTQTISSANWGADSGGGFYSQTITLSGSLTFDTISIQIRLSTGHIIHPTIERASATTYTIYTYDNTLTYTAVYT